MPSINMIAPRREEKKRLESNVKRLVLAIMVEIAIIMCVTSIFVMRIIGIKADIDGNERHLAKLEPLVKEIKGFEAQTYALKPKIETLNGAEGDTLRWCTVLNDVSMSLPEKTWLTRISTMPPQPSATDITLNLNGVSADQGLVGETMLRMHDTVREFNKIDLNFTQKATLGRATAVEFEMAATIKLPKKEDTKGEVEKS